MKRYIGVFIHAPIFFLTIFVVLVMMGCSGSDDSSDSAETGSAVFKIQWPDETESASLSQWHSASANDTQSAGVALLDKMTVSDDCNARGVVTVAVKVTDASGSPLASDEFDCALGEGTLDGISIGSGRRFVVSGLDESGNEKYRGQKSDITITAGVNDIGLIQMERVDNSSPVALISNPTDGIRIFPGNSIMFSGTGEDAEDGPLNGSALVWMSDLDGQIGTGISFSTNTLSEGIHTITLTVTDNDGASGSARIKLAISANTPPVIQSLTADLTQGKTPLKCNLTCTASDSDGTVDSYAWDFGDGQTQTTTSGNVSHIFSSAGSYDVTCTVTDNDGATDTSNSFMITALANQAPVVTALTSDPAQGKTPLKCNLTCTASDSDGSIVSYVWDFGDGQTATTTSGNVSHVFSSAGSYDVTCTITDNDGATDTSNSFMITALANQAPVVTSLTADPAQGKAPLKCNLTCTASDSDGTIVSYAWDFGDGQTGTTTTGNVSHVFSSAGSYNVTCTVTDNDGVTGNSSIVITVNSPPVAIIESPEDGGTFIPGYGILFSGHGEDAEDGELIGNSCAWTSDIDGEIASHHSIKKDNLSSGTHTITLTVTDSDGETGSASVEITINALPVATITSPADGSRYSTGTEVIFSGIGEDAEDGTLDDGSLVWTSDIDGQIGTGTTFSTNSLSIGGHTVTLTVTDSNGTTSTSLVSTTIIQPKLPDTGQTYPARNAFGLPVIGEDSQYTINPPSYTKLDEQGNGLPVSAASWPMVRDNNTGLIWEVKAENDISIHYMGATYTFQNAQDVFIANLNENAFGGYTDWRLPTVLELSLIVDAEEYNPAINETYFPNTRFAAATESGYWTSTNYTNGLGRPWVVGFATGRPLSYEETMFSVRAVRGREFSTGNFRDNGNGTITDTKTGLMWQKSHPESVGYPSQMTWAEAIAYCEDLSLAGYTDWRLPNRNELQSIVDYTRKSPSINTTYFPDAQSPCWSSTTYMPSDTSAWGVQFYYGYFDTGYKAEDLFYVRAVRGGQ